MKNFALLIFPAFLLFFTFAKGECAKKGEFSPELWNGRQAKMIQAFACIGVILHHATQTVTSYGTINRGPITLFSTSGFLFTALFFFFSGFGLIVSVETKPGYLNGFLRHRLPIVLVPFFVANLIYVLEIIFLKKIPMSADRLIRCILGLRLINGNGWYMVEIFFLYLAFFLIFKIINNRDIATLILCVVTVFIIAFSYKSGHDTIGDYTSSWFKGEWWYNSTAVFIMGVLVARFRTQIIEFLKKHYQIMVMATALLFFISFGAEEYILKTRGYYLESVTIDRFSNQAITYTAQTVLCLVFTTLVLLINMKISLGNQVLNYVSKISVEVFLIQNLFVNGLANRSEIGDFLYFLLVIAGSILSASVMEIVDRAILKNITKDSDIKKPKNFEDFKIKEQGHLTVPLLAENKPNTSIKKKYGIKISTALIGLALIAAVFVLGIKITSSIQTKNAMEKISEASVGDIVEFGHYETDPRKPGKEKVAWIVLDRQGDTVMLLAQKGLEGDVYNQKYEETTWEKSDLRVYLNEKMYAKMFSDKEVKYIIQNPETEDMLSLLSEEEAKKYFKTDKDRELAITKAAENSTYVNNYSKVHQWDEKGYRSSWWWLRGDTPSLFAPIVTVDGEITSDTRYANKPNGAIRPVVWVKPTN